jgi:hypothetical protein
MANLDTLNRAELLAEITEIARSKGLSNASDWALLVDEVLESHLDIAELNDDQDLEGMKQTLKDAWSEYVREAGEESPTAIGEDPEKPHE